jgi:hypothetical protein
VYFSKDVTLSWQRLRMLSKQMKICLNLENREEDDEENYTSLFSKPTLRKDKKFIKLPKEIRRDFDNSYNDFVS